MLYGLIGEHLTHSYSREIHAKIADYSYELKELRPEELDGFFRERTFRAINVTIPYKQSVIPYLDEISEVAKRIGAVNTIVNRNGKLYGYNTDFAGMEAMIRHAGISLRGKKVLVLGTGGTSKTAVAVAEHLNSAGVWRVSRTAKDGAVTYQEALARHWDAQVILNTTPVGMFPATQAVPLPLSAFPHLSGVLDAIYHPLRTNLVLAGAEQNIPSSGGLYMLVTQAVYASALFLGEEPKEELADKIYREIEAEKRNIVLVGMPSSGKTTVGKQLAALTGRPFTDTDAEVEQKIGMSIAEYFRQSGEESFRAVEREVVREASLQSGAIIATGGGVILSPENLRNLRQNGVVVFLDRAPDLLIATADRPLSSGKEALEKLYVARKPLYRAAAEFTVNGNGTPQEVAEIIRKELAP